MSSWQPGWDDFPQPLLDFWTERHLCTLATVRSDGSPHNVPERVAIRIDVARFVFSSGLAVTG